MVSYMSEFCSVANPNSEVNYFACTRSIFVFHSCGMRLIPKSGRKCYKARKFTVHVHEYEYYEHEHERERKRGHEHEHEYELL